MPARGVKFSVVVPAFNTEKMVGATVRSALNQTEQDLEVIVIDDGSQDRTADRVAELQREDPRVKLIRQSNMGPSGARNTGVASAEGRYLAFLDSDDLLLPSYLRAVNEIFDRGADVGIAWTEAWVMDDPGDRIRRRIGATSHRRGQQHHADVSELLTALAACNFIYGVPTVRRKALLAAGPFDTGLSHAEDFEMWLRIAAEGWREDRTREPHMIIRDRPGSLHTNEAQMLRSIAEVCRRVIADDSFPPAARDAAAEQLAARQQELEMLTCGGTRALQRRLRRRLGATVRRRLPWLVWRLSRPPEVERTLRASARPLRPQEAGDR